MVQRYLPAIVDGDKRVLVIGGKPVPHCLARIPKAAGARQSRPAARAGGPAAHRAGPRGLPRPWPHPRPRGLLLVGLDVIGDTLTEINVTSPTCFQEITQQSGFDVAAMFIDALEAALQAA